VIDRSDRKIVLACWLAAVGAGAAWAGQLIFGYVVVDASCGEGTHRWGIPARVVGGGISLAALLVAAAAVFVGHRLMVAAQAGDPRERVEFLGFWGVIGGLFFCALIVVTAIGIVVLDPCHQG
jgi:hypothetical protein